MFDNLFNLKKDDGNKSEMEDILKNKVVRIAFVNIDEEAYKPLPYVMIANEVDLFENATEFSEIKEELKKSFKDLEPDRELKNYTILEYEYTAVEKLFLMEAEFSILNAHLKLLPESTMLFDIIEIINDEKTDSKTRFNLIALNYGVKIYNMLYPKGLSWESSIKGEDIRITSTGAVEKYVFDLFQKYKVTMYKISEQEDVKYV